jgi:hypothetical protein
LGRSKNWQKNNIKMDLKGIYVKRVGGVNAV